jgi:gamma-glutamylcyclotransferase (GGCT)/AIG2-like uncharacterized protein YtfP
MILSKLQILLENNGYNIKVFTYGTLHNGVGKLLKRDIKLIVDTLTGHKLIDLGKGYTSIIKDDESTVPGFVFEVNKEELNKLDDWEDKYKRITVNIDGNNVFVYQIKNNKELDENLNPDALGAGMRIEKQPNVDYMTRK